MSDASLTAINDGYCHATKDELTTIPMREPGESTADYRERVRRVIDAIRWRRVPKTGEWWLTWGP